MWAPRSPCGENRVLRYSTVRYMYLLHETLHYVSSFLLLVYTLQVPYLPLDVQVMSSTSLLGTVLKRYPPSHRKPAYFPSFPQRHPSLSLSLVHDTLSTLQHTSGRYLGNTRHTYINNQNPPSLTPLLPSDTNNHHQTNSHAMCSDVHYPIPRNRKLLNRVRYCTSFYAEATR